MRRAQQPFSVVAALAAVALTAAACATIMHGSSQEIGIASQPTGAKIRVDNRELGVTPLTAKLSRKDVHTISISMAGYQPYELTTTRHTSGWVWGKDRKSTRLNSSHMSISYAVFCLKKKN